MSDAAVFACSGLYNLLARTIYDPSYPGKYVLGDSAYGLRVFCMRAFSYDTADEKEKVMNAYCHSTRAVVDNAFDRLKGRFRCASPRAAHLSAALRACARRLIP